MPPRATESTLNIHTILLSLHLIFYARKHRYVLAQCTKLLTASTLPIRSDLSHCRLIPYCLPTLSRYRSSGRQPIALPLHTHHNDRLSDSGPDSRKQCAVAQRALSPVTDSVGKRAPSARMCAYSLCATAPTFSPAHRAITLTLPPHPRPFLRAPRIV